MDGITIATEMRPHVIYAMFNEGAQLDTIQAAIKGIGPRQLDVLKRQYNNGVPADLATTIVREHPRQKPSAPKTIRVEVGAHTLAIYEKKAKKHGLTVDGIAAQAIRDRFNSL